MQSKRFNWGLWVFACAVACGDVCAGHVELQVIASEDQRAPNVPGQPSARFSIIYPPALNEAGQLAFYAILSHASISDDKANAIWGGTPDNLRPVIREGDSAPGTTWRFQDFANLPLLSDGGHILFNADLENAPSERDEGVWLAGPNGVELLAQTGVSTGGTPWALESLVGIMVNGDYAVGDGGHAAFKGVLSNVANSLWFGRPGQMAVVAYNDMLLPAGRGFSSGSRVASLSDLGGPAISVDGKLVFQATISAESGSRDDSIIIADGNGLQLVASEGAMPPGLPGDEFRSFRDPAINNVGRVAFEAALKDFDESLWVGTPGNLQMLVRQGDPAPVGIPGAYFVGADTFSEIRLNDAGELAFIGQFFYTGIPSNNNTGLFVAGKEGVRLVALEAQVGSIASYSLNNAGEVAFVTLGDRVFATDERGTLNLVRSPGPAGDDHIFHSGSPDDPEYSSPWNSRFQLAFATEFASSNRIYLATVSVPEASTFALALIAAGIAACGRRH
ncbi:MAG TPA: choice-of-anchor tandem repeat NxxGxxAF-containing protein [Lacipirellulaceae bacterium]|nr:choice-of-anchor tandem repeat NxxGxxAF-containing protein [Lacipirellulaceae bacterium]